MCIEEDCENEIHQRSMCKKHYMRWYRASREQVCLENDCDRAVYCRSLCESHYKKVLREENSEYDASQRAMKPSREATDRKLEKQREKRLLRNPYRFSGGVVSYDTAHRRLRKWRGKASEHSCVDCGGTAKHWSLSNDAETILWGMDKGSRLAYSLNMYDYSPRCTKCHGEYDSKSA